MGIVERFNQVQQVFIECLEIQVCCFFIHALETQTVDYSLLQVETVEGQVGRGC